MTEFKEMTIGRLPSGSVPFLNLNGKWLEEFGFTSGTNVTIINADNCLTLLTGEVDAPVSAFSLMVTSRMMRGKPRTQLLLNGLMLKRWGYNIGDRVCLSLAYGMIQITNLTRTSAVS